MPFDALFDESRDGLPDVEGERVYRLYLREHGLVPIGLVP